MISDYIAAEEQERVAFENIVTKYYESLVKYVATFTIGEDEEIKQDIIDETFFKVLDKPELFLGYDKLWPTLKATARNIFKDNNKRLVRKRIKCSNYCDFYSTYTASMEAIIVQNISLHSAIKQLDLVSKQIIVLCYFYGHTLKDIADLLSIGYTTILYRHKKAINLLRSYLDDDYIFVDDIDILNTHAKRQTIDFIFLLFILYLCSKSTK